MADGSGYLDRPTRSLNEVRARRAAEAAKTLGDYLVNLRARAAAAGKCSDWMASDVQLTIWGDGSGSLSIRLHRCGKESTPIADAILAAEEWVATDDVAIANETLGLTADGRFADAPLAPDAAE